MVKISVSQWSLYFFILFGFRSIDISSFLINFRSSYRCEIILSLIIITLSPSLASRNRILYCTYPIFWLAASALVVCSNVRSTGNLENSFLVAFNGKHPFMKSLCISGWVTFNFSNLLWNITRNRILGSRH